MPLEEAVSLGLGEDAERWHPLLNGEVSFILERYQESKQKCSSIVQQSIAYTAKLNNYLSAQHYKDARDFLETIQEESGMTHYESALLHNLHITSAPAAIALIPSLSSKFPNTEALDAICNTLREIL